MEEEETYYLEGIVMGSGKDRRFEPVRSTDGSIYVTRNPHGSKSTTENANVYKLSKDLRTVYLVKANYVRGDTAPPVFEISEEQSDEIRDLIEAGRFIDLTRVP